MLAACALPGASGTGSLATATNPTQESCAARGLTLDASSKQCVITLPSQGAETTGSLPSRATAAEQPSSPSAQQAPVQPKAGQQRPQQSQPQQAQPQQPPDQSQQLQERRASISVPIEPGAVIKPDSPQSAETAVEFAHFVRASGYRCDSISALTPRSGGFILICNRSTFRYAIKEKDGRSVVTVE